MVAERLSMRKLREVFRLYFEQKLSRRAIAISCNVSPSTVVEYVLRAKALKLSWPLSSEMDDEGLERLLFPQKRLPAGSRPEPDYTYIHLELKRKHVTLQLLWQEYRECHADGYQYSQYCELYRRWATKLNPTMRQIHRAGEKTFVDFSGDGLTIIDPKTGESQEAPLFVAVLGCSNYTYAEPVLHEDLPTWLGCHVRAFEYFEGVSEIIVPDNPKVGVTRPHLYEPDINLAYAELARHYEVAVIPARSRKPRDKAKVEQGVLLAERWILAKLRNQVFFSLQEAREAVQKLVVILNERQQRRVKKSRRQLFEEIERAALKPLPATPYEFSNWARPKANIDYHVLFDDHFYSVPYALIHEVVDLRATETIIEIFFKGRRITSHLRSYEKGQSTTKREHMPRSHQGQAEWTPTRILEWAQRAGPSTAALCEKIIQERSLNRGCRSCLGIMRLRDSYGDERVEQACERALRFRACSYKSVAAILKNNLDRAHNMDRNEKTDRALPEHDNIRGPSYYH